MNLIEKIRKPIEKEIEQFEKSMTEELKTENPLLKNISNTPVGQRQAAPTYFGTIVAKLCGKLPKYYLRSNFTEQFMPAIHDDVVDNTFQRRGLPSINAQWNNKVAY